MKKLILTEEQELYIKNNWNKLPISVMAKSIGCGNETLRKKAMALNLSHSNIWTENDQARLKELSKILFTCEEIAKELERTPNAVYVKARKMGIVLYLDGRKWTNEDKDLLKKWWGTRRIEYIARDLHRSTGAINLQASRMHLGPKKENITDYILIADLSDLFSISVNRIRKVWFTHGLKTRKIYVSKDKYYLGVTLENLMKFLKNNQDLWDSKKLEKNILGPEPKWLLLKREKDKNFSPSINSQWTNEEKSLAIFWIKQRKSYEFIATKINRSPSAIAHFLEDNGYSYLLPKFLTSKDILYIKENMEVKTTKEIANDLKRNPSTIANMKLKLRYKIWAYVPHTWTEEENEYLKHNYRKITNYELANHFSVCREILIEQLKVLGLYKRQTHLWTIEEETYLKKFYKKGMKATMRKRFYITNTALDKKLKELGIDSKRLHSEYDLEVINARRQLLCVLKNLLEERKDNSLSR